MANQNFRVKRGLEVGANGGIDLYADNSGVGINSIEPRVELDVRGDAFLETLDIVNPAGVSSTNPALDVVGYSTFTGPIFVDGDGEFTGNLSLTDLSLRNLDVSGFGTINNLGFNTGIGSTMVLDYLRINEDIDIRGTGVATIGGDPVFNSLTVLGISTFAGEGGVSTFYDDVNFVQDILVSAGGSVFTPNLGFNTGIGQTLTLDYLRINEDIDVKGTGIATIGGDPVFNSLTVTGLTTLGAPGSAGVTTTLGDLYVGGDLFVRDDIFYDEISGRNLYITGIGTVNELRWAVGVGTSTQLEYLNVSGVSTVAFSTTKEAFVGILTADLIDAKTIELDVLNVGQIGVNTIFFNRGIGTNLVMSGVSTFNGPVIIDNVLGVTSSVSIGKSLVVDGGVVIGGGLTVSGSVDIDINVDVDIDANLNVSGIATINDLRFNVGLGSTLTVEDLFVTGDIDVNGTGVATIGGDPIFNTLAVLGISTFAGEGGISTFYDGVNIFGDLNVGAGSSGSISAGGTITSVDINFINGVGTNLTLTGVLAADSADLDFLNVSGIATINDLNVTGITTTEFLTVDQNVVGPLRVGGSVVIDGTTTRGSLQIGDGLILTGGDILAFPTVPSSIEVDDVTIKGTLNVTGGSETANITNNLTVGNILDTQELRFVNGAGTSLNVGYGTFTDLHAVDLTVYDQTQLQDLRVLGIASINGAGIATIKGDAEFSSLIVTGISSFVGFASFTSGINVTGIATLQELTVTGDTRVSTFSASGFSTFGQSVNVRETLEAGKFIGVASEITYYPAPLVGFGTEPPTVRPNGDPVQFGDTWFDETGLRQYIYYPNDPTGVATDPQPFWIDANPVAAIPALNLQADIQDSTSTTIPPGTVPGTGTVGLGSAPLVFQGTPDNVTTFIDENIVRFALPSTVRVQNLIIDGTQTIGETAVGDFYSSGIASLNNVSVAGTFSAVGFSSFANDVLIGRDLDVLGALTVGNGADITGDLVVSGYADFAGINVTGVGTFQDINSLSDRRVKENVKTIENPLDTISKIRGVDFTFINTGKKSTGVIAQEVEQVMPHLIAGDFPKSVNYNGLIGLLIESVKELKEQNSALEKRITDLERDKKG